MAISITVRETEDPKPIPEGEYKAILKNVSEEVGEYGDYIRFFFEITEGEQRGVTRIAMASKKLSRTSSGKTSKLLEIAQALTGSRFKAGEVFDIEELIGKECRVLIKNGKRIGDVVYQKVSEVMPLRNENGQF